MSHDDDRPEPVDAEHHEALSEALAQMCLVLHRIDTNTEAPQPGDAEGRSNSGTHSQEISDASDQG